MPEAVIFDLDYTIAAPDTTSDEFWRGLCERFAHRLPGFETEQVLKAITQTGNWYWSDPERHRQGRLDFVNSRRELVALAFESLGINDYETSDMIADAYTYEREEAIRVIPGALETLARFRDNGSKLGLITNGPAETQRAKIERFNLAGFFNHIIVEGEFGKGKPDKEVFLSMLKKLDTKPEDTWMVGDDLERDIAGARQVGIYSIWVDWRGDGLPEPAPVRPDRTVRSIVEIHIDD